MTTIATEEAGAGRSLEETSSEEQHCQSSEALAEWRSSEQVENGITSTSPPYWDSDDDDDSGPKPSELYGKYTWKIDKFSQINKRELRSNAFEVGGYKWYILIYPQGCDVCNHLSLFLCVANHEKLLPGWSHFAQFTIAVVNKDPKKSKYSDTLHRFWKKEHDWGWKKFMELSKVLDGFLDSDTLIIKAQVQVIRERADRPFRCLDCQYRRELVRVYLTNVEQICRRFVEERRSRLGKLIEDKARWSSFCAFWLGMDQNSRRRMSKEKSDAILKVVVKYFFIEKEVTSTLVMDSLYSGLKALEGQHTGKKGKGRSLDLEEQPVPIVKMEKDMFVLVDDVLLLLERAALEQLPPKEEKGPQNRTKDGASGDDFNKDSIERDERRLTELGRRTIEIVVLAQIFSKIEVAYQEAVALKRQEELIREEEAAWMAETEHKSKKEKKSKKKQGKQKRNNRKVKDKEKEEKPSVVLEDKTEGKLSITEGTEETESVVEKPDTPEETSDISDSVECVPEVLNHDSEGRDVSPVNWDTDTVEIHPSMDTSCSGLGSFPSSQNGIAAGRRSPAVDDSSSTCSTDSTPSVVMNGSYRGNHHSNHKNQKSASRGRNNRRKSAKDTNWSDDSQTQQLDTTTDNGQLSDTSGSSRKPGTEIRAAGLSSREQHVQKEVVVLQQKKRNGADTEGPSKNRTSVFSPPKAVTSTVQSKPELKSSYNSLSVKKLTPDIHNVADKSVQVKSPRESYAAKSDAPRSVDLKALKKPSSQQVKPSTHQVAATSEKPSSQVANVSSRPSRPSSAPLVGPRPTAPVVSIAQTPPLLARSQSMSGQLRPDSSAAPQSFVPQSYRNAMMGCSAGFDQQPQSSLAVSASHSHSQPPPHALISAPFSPHGPEIALPSSIRPSFSYEMMNHGPQWMDSAPQRDSRSIAVDFPVLNDSRNSYLYKPVNSRSHDDLPSMLPPGTSRRQTPSVFTDFPHLDIINDLLDDEHGLGMVSEKDTSFQSYSNGFHHLTRHSTFPGDLGMPSESGPSMSSCRFERTQSYDNMFQHSYPGGGVFDGVTDMIPQASQQSFVNGKMNGFIPDHWQMVGSSPYLGMSNAESDTGYPYPPMIPDYSNMACGVNGYPVFRTSNGL
ncbi:PREDICTED: MATH domain-containing protein At5g43560-like [Ipomoea nil]|uniref:MATH domain-containing protein At5g43560-like n=1 Tax=Ipomoea nil TaxID=35883 RepID=UPI0009011EF6|nr:PREDICTED: MATH domain-containing protein At5g43560-like [Ipomoea nil]XP_019191359.1 PREDICTED: MATH domain-containing protein At5g43560-like [Ipomoea nil]